MRRVSLRSGAGYMYYKVRRIENRVRHNYYLKNWIECKRNRELLKDARNAYGGENKNEDPLISVRIATYNRGRFLQSARYRLS